MPRPQLSAAPLVAAALALAACRGTPAPLPAPRVAADSARADTVAPGVVHRTWFVAGGPWVVHALDVDRRACWSPMPLKAKQPFGPARELLTGMARRARQQVGAREVGGAVNADFFLFAPDGLPTGAHVHAGIVVFGPSGREVLAVDSARRLHVGRFAAEGWIVAGRDSVRLDRWNRPEAGGVALIDPAYGERVDSARLGVALALQRVAPGRMATPGFASGRAESMVVGEVLAPGPTAPRVPANGALVVAGRATPDSVRAALLRIGRAGDTVRVRIAIRPFHPRDAVGGNGVLLARGAVPARLDSVGNEGFRGRHPRTAVGFTRDGRRLFYVVVDGRQPGYSAGMTLRELATFMRQLGADEALNLDGGGSSAMVVPDLRSDSAVQIANRPSDPRERPVANGLAVIRSCGR